jgi:hypothetical protein
MATKHTNDLIESTKRKLSALRRKRVSKRITEICWKCDGVGRIQYYSYYADGVCFQCKGVGKWPATVRVFEDPDLEAQAQELETIIQDEVYRLELIQNRHREYLRDWQAAIWEDERRTRAAGQRHLNADVGARVDIEAVVTFTKILEGIFGASMLVLAKTDAGEIVKTIGTGSGLWNIAKGDRVALRGTVKAHETYQGAPQSVLTRVKASILQDA